MGNRCDAVDVGNGHTKFAIGANDRGHPIIKSMPSWAIKGSSSEVGNGAKDNVDLVNVGVGEQRFLVGKDSTLEVHRRDRVRTADFCMKDEYQALVSGALHYAGVNSDVDVLVLGLPVKRLNNYRADLEAKYSGIELSLPNGTVKVKEARVYAQPVGGLFLWGMEKGGDRMKRLLNERSLVIDPGHGTLDWLVTEGFKVIESRSDAIEDAGMGSVLRRMKSEIEAREIEMLNGETLDIDLLDMAFIDPTKRRGKLRKLDWDKYRAIGAEAVNDALDRMFAGNVGNLSDIDNVLVIGGGGSIYAPEISKRIKGIDFIVRDDGRTMNAGGFYLLAQKRLRELKSGK